MQGKAYYIILSRLCSDVIDLKVVLNLNIKYIELFSGSLLGLLGLLLGSLDQDELRLFLLLNELALPAGGIGLLSFNDSCSHL